MNGSSACWGDSGGNVPVACVDGAQEKVLAEYIWLGGSGTDLHSKSKVLDCKPTCVEDLPVVVVDGSSCGQAVADDYEVYLRPRKMYTDPFRGGDHLLVLCDVVVPPPVTADPAKKDVVQPHPSNNRAPCEAVMARAAHQQPVFAVEQEYTLMDPATSWPMGWPAKSFPEPARPYYGGAGTGVSMGRDFAEAHMQACLQAGVKLSGVCATATPGQWSYQVGPCQGIQLGDELWVSRYLLLRMSERYKIIASLDPKPIPGDWNGSGCYVKYSTAETRTAGTGLNAIQDHLQRLHSAHAQHMTAYGQGNTRRFSDKAPADIKFTCGFSNKTCSVTIPRATLLNRGGYYSDRRPASNMDPYLVTMLLVSTTLAVPLPAGNEPVVLSFSKHSSKPSMSAFPCPSATSCYSGESSGANTEDVLIDELDRLDHQFAPDTPPNMYPSGLTYSESSDECSDGTSPEQRSPLALAMHQDEMYCC